jgi:hypothetical protein
VANVRVKPALSEAEGKLAETILAFAGLLIAK